MRQEPHRVSVREPRRAIRACPWERTNWPKCQHLIVPNKSGLGIFNGFVALWAACGSLSPLRSGSYIETHDGWLYLAGILDLYSRKVAGWSTSDSLAAELVTVAWKKAWEKHRTAPGLLHHSDRECVIPSLQDNPTAKFLQ